MNMANVRCGSAFRKAALDSDDDEDGLEKTGAPPAAKKDEAAAKFLKEPKLKLLANGETVKISDKGTKNDTERDAIPTDPATRRANTLKSGHHPLVVKTTTAETTASTPKPSPVPRPPSILKTQHYNTKYGSKTPSREGSKNASKEKSENNRMRNIYKRILNPSGESCRFRVIEGEQRHMLHRRLIADTRGKYAAPHVPPKWEKKKPTRKVRVLAPGESAGRGAATMQKYQQVQPTTSTKSPLQDTPAMQQEGDLQEQLQQVTDADQVTLIPVNVRDSRHKNMNGERDQTRISYRLGLSPTPVADPTMMLQDDQVVDDIEYGHSASPTKSPGKKLYRPTSRDNHNVFMKVDGRAEQWRRGPKSTPHDGELRLESACGGESPSPAVSVTAADTLLRGSLKQQRVDRRGRLSQAQAREYEPELTTTELLSQLKCWPAIKRLLE